MLPPGKLQTMSTVMIARSDSQLRFRNPAEDRAAIDFLPASFIA